MFPKLPRRLTRYGLQLNTKSFQPSYNIKTLQKTLFIIPKNLGGRQILQPTFGKRPTKFRTRNVVKRTTLTSLNHMKDMIISSLIHQAKTKHVSRLLPLL